ncbi:uncharacterized protein LOC127629205 [Xyrauchen texanus]|uniref:uncharacterized protein LOC127629205 n=1 Tax=Xyrauchen texanus TaxID=154827 RepID=UPI002241D705|nr:uncharacterized protein LOC127629205 [Xyrauchen texanus]
MMELEVIRMSGETSCLTVDSNATVGELKQRISEVFKDHPSEQKLSANNGHRIDLEDDSKTLSSYGIPSGSTVALFITDPKPFQVFVKNVKGFIGTYDVSINETVDQLQAKIFNKERVPVDQQMLTCNSCPLEAGKKLQDYDIKPRSTIQMTLRLRGGS